MYQLSGKNTNHTPHHWYVCLFLRSWSVRWKGSIWLDINHQLSQFQRKHYMSHLCAK